MNTELVASPRSDVVRSAMTEAHDWPAYATELRRFLTTVIKASGADPLEVDELLVSRPLPEELAELRNGSQVDRAEAVDLVVGMAAGDGPYCRLTSPGRLRIESGWDGAMHFFVASGIAEEVSIFRSDLLEVERRVAAPEPVDTAETVRYVTDKAFWARVQEHAGAKMTLLCERWAYGAFGCRWFRVTAENAEEVARAVRPRSLLSVTVDPDLRLEPLLLDDDFTAFKPPLVPGELTYRAYPGGADSVAELTDDGFTFMLGESVPAAWSAVVPDSDGVVRKHWEDFGAP